MNYFFSCLLKNNFILLKRFNYYLTFLIDIKSVNTCLIFKNVILISFPRNLLGNLVYEESLRYCNYISN